jgi:hypothetical protein
VKLDVVEVAPSASVTVTDTVDDPVAVGVPEMVPVVELILKPATSAPFNEYANGLRPPVADTASENALAPELVNPVVGAEMAGPTGTVRVAVAELVATLIPERVFMACA